MRKKNENEITEILKMIAPGTPIRDGLENILRERDTVYVISGYYDSLPDDCDVIRAVW